MFCGMKNFLMPLLVLCCDCMRFYQRKSQNRASISYTCSLNRKSALLNNWVKFTLLYSFLIDRNITIIFIVPKHSSYSNIIF